MWYWACGIQSKYDFPAVEAVILWLAPRWCNTCAEVWGRYRTQDLHHISNPISHRFWVGVWELCNYKYEKSIRYLVSTFVVHTYTNIIWMFLDSLEWVTVRCWFGCSRISWKCIFGASRNRIFTIPKDALNSDSTFFMFSKVFRYTWKPLILSSWKSNYSITYSRRHAEVRFWKK